MKRFSCVYQITHIPSSRVYIGSAVNFALRKARHIRELNSGRHPNYHLQRAWLKYGEIEFRFDALEHVTEIEHLLEREQFWIDQRRAVGPEGFNLCPNAGSTLGRQVKESTYKRLLSVNKGRVRSAETRAKMSAAKKGHTYSQGVKHPCAKLTESQVRKIRDRLLGGERQYILAKEFGVNRASIHSLRIRKSWKHIP